MLKNAYSLSNYRGLLDEVQEALENSTSEREFKDELDNLIDDHLSFVSDEQIEEMDESVDDNMREPEQDGILYLDDYSQEELEQLDPVKLAVNNIKVYYHHVLYEYFSGCHVTILDAESENVVIDNPILNSDTWLTSYGMNRKHMKSLSFDLPTSVDNLSIDNAYCEILDLSNVQCRRIEFGNCNHGGFDNTKIIKLPSSDNIEIKFRDKAFTNSKVQNIVNS